MSKGERVVHLDVETPQGPSGILANERGSYLFGYHSVAAAEQAVSLTMPIRRTPYTSGALPPIFQMNLPEGFVLEELRNRLSKVARVDPMLLLAVTGSVHPIGRVFVRSDAVVELLSEASDSAHGERLEDILSWQGGTDVFRELVDRYILRSGISGVQPKVVVPERATLHMSQLIVKSGRDAYPGLALNEYICMTIAKDAGLPVPPFWLSEDRALFVMRRFDRAEDGTALGFEDMAVLTGRSSERKYEGSYEMIAKAVRAFCAPEHMEESLQHLFDSVALSCMVGNGDAHLKNFGVVYSEPSRGDSRLAPIYDVVNTTAYFPKDVLALKLSGSKAFAGGARLVEFARACGVQHPDDRIDRLIAVANRVLTQHKELLATQSLVAMALSRALAAFTDAAQG